MKKFTEVLEEYLDERDRQNSGYYDVRYLGDAISGQRLMRELANELNEMVQGVEE